MSSRDLAPCFSYDAFTRAVMHFSDTIPELLTRHPATAPLALEIGKLHLQDTFGTRFTVAVIGQMRVGKSTLVNALIGSPLAPVGVTETTATINWFRYGAGDACDCFRVHWKDGSTDDLPLARAAEWIGQAEHATRTRALDFFAESDFLKTANIVDTPGTRSVLEEHSDATHGFLDEKMRQPGADPATADAAALARKLEADTYLHGGRADAIVYVINPVARTDDKELLQMIGDRTRLPGASAYNSIAVVQKWEHLEPDPVAEVKKKCERLRLQLQGKVGEVVYASGMLANLAAGLQLGMWVDLARLATESSEAALEAMLCSPAFFSQETAGAALDPERRRALYDSMPWAALKFILRMAQAGKLADPGALRQAIDEVSGMAQLKRLLQDRFFSLSALIKASTALRKAWHPCTVALLQLRELATTRQEELRLGQQSLALMAAHRHDKAYQPVFDYLARSLSAVDNDLRQVLALREQLEGLLEHASRNFHSLDADITCLEALDRLPAALLTPDERHELQHLFGERGPDLRTRLMLADGTPVDNVRERAWDRHDFWATRRARVPALRQVSEHALTRLDEALAYLEDDHD